MSPLHRSIPVLFAITMLPIGCSKSAPSGGTNTESGLKLRSTQIVDPLAVSILGDADVRRARDTRVPVLVAKPEGASVSPLIVKANFYSLSLAVPKGIVNIQGALAKQKIEIDLEKFNPVDVRGFRAVSTTNESIRTISWAEGAFVYSVDMECEEASDARCTNAEFVTGLARGLVYAGGGE
ncbi:MAG: hypothetical protein KBF88_05390 [Polyangiaceae bacterium]|nr:hypothetical protein [Polyangiaceae bacterium]